MKMHTSILSGILLLLSLGSCAQKRHTAPTAPNKASTTDLSVYKQATFAAGCFWHEEALFESVKGVKEAVSGYAGGTTRNPSYEDVSTGTTGHSESVTVYYDSTQITYPQLLKVYFEAQEDPTQVNGQGPDNGTEYRTIAFYRNDAEKAMIEKYISDMNHSGKYKQPISTEVMPYTTFWKAEDYHQDYIQHNPNNPYVQGVSIPAIKRFQQECPAMIKPGKKF